MNTTTSISPSDSIAQLTNTVVMVQPVQFGFNTQTAGNTQTGELDNVYQNYDLTKSEEEIRDRALTEFHAMVQQLRQEGITVIVVDNPRDARGVYQNTPDAVFPNNWVSFHHSKIILYPMKAPNRRMERQLPNVLATLKKAGKGIDQPVVDLTSLEETEHFLEGTGSLVFDRPNKVAFASLSSRTTPEGLAAFCDATGYTPVTFHAVDAQGNDVYHTNVVMSIGKDFAVVCLECIPTQAERQKVQTKLTELNKTIITITQAQMAQMCGNILQVQSESGPKVVLSQTAHRGFTPDQLDTLQQFGKLVTVAIPQIEETGGGSVRCMMAEVFEV